MELREALYELGVREETLSEDEAARLDSEGYVQLPGILSADEVLEVRAVLEGVYAVERTGREDGPAESSYMQNKTAGLDLCLTNPRVLAGIARVLDGQVKSFGIHGRPHPPGGEQQGLHVDYNGPAPTGKRFAVANSLWMLDDFTAVNGATRVVPGSHLWEQRPEDAMDMGDRAQPHPDEVLMLGRAGTVVVWNSHLWHGTTANRSDAIRQSLPSFYCRCDDPHMVFSSALSEEAAARLGTAARCLFADADPWSP